MSQQARTDQLIQQSVEALESGDRSRARELLSQALRLDRENDQAWYYLAWALETAYGARLCLEKVLQIDPNHSAAKRLLARIEGEGVQGDQKSECGRDKQVLDLSIEREHLQTLVAERRSSVEGLQDEAASLRERISALDSERGQLQQARAQHRILLDRLEDLRGQVATREQKVKSLESVLGDVEAQLEKRRQALEEVNENLSAMRTDSKSAREELDQLRAERERLKTLVAQRQASVDKLRDEAESLREQVGGLRADREELEDARDELGSLLDRLENLRQQAKSGQQRVKTVEADLADAEARLSQKRQAMEHLDQRVTDMEDQADVARQRLDRLQEERERLDSAVAERRGSVRDLRAEAESLREQIGALKTRRGQLEKAHAELDSLVDQAEELRERAAAEEQRAKSAEARLGEAETRLVEKQKLADELQKRAKILQGQIEDREGALTALRQEAATLREEIRRREAADIRSDVLGGDQVGMAVERALQNTLQKLSLGQGSSAAASRPRLLTVLLICLAVLLVFAGAYLVYPYIQSRLKPRLSGAIPRADVSPAQQAAFASDTHSDGGAVSDAGVLTSTASSLWASMEGGAPPTPRPTAVSPPTPVPSIPTRIVIPNAAVDAPVVRVSWTETEVDGQRRGGWQVPATYAAGWHEDSAPLGTGGNTVLNGHNTTNGEVFRDLYKLQVGDVITAYSNGLAFSYAVAEAFVVPEADQSADAGLKNASYLAPTEDERLTLITYHPHGELSKRLIVIARPDKASGESTRRLAD